MRAGASACNENFFERPAPQNPDLTKVSHCRRQLEKDFFNLIETMIKILGSKDSYTSHHSFFVMEISVGLARRFDFGRERLERMRTAALLHDIGKVGIPYGILNKKEKLTDAEFAMIREHPVIGSLMVEDFEKFAGIDRIIRYHHERFDGKGYPSGISGAAIPMEARIISVVDSYHAMASRRSYKESLDRAYIVEELRRCRGTQFDPEVVDVFIDMIETDPTFAKYEKAYVNSGDWRIAVAAQEEPLPDESVFEIAEGGGLEQDFDRTLDMLLFVMKLQETDIYQYGERVCELAVAIGEEMGLSPGSLRELRIASLLHGIGEIAFIKEELEGEGGRAVDDAVLAVASHSILSPMNRFENTARIIRAQWENCDGSGLPDGLSGDEIPIESAILRVANVASSVAGKDDAAGHMAARLNKEYRPDVVDALLKILKK